MTDVNQLIIDHLDIWTAATEKKSSAGRGSGGAVSLYGVKKLRELILELALAGKLVEQRLSEGMGSDLVSDAIRQKAELQTNAARKTKASQVLGSDATSTAFPLQWGVASLGDVCEIIRGITFSAKDKHDGPAPGLVACLRTSNVQEQIETDDLIFVDPKFIKKDAQRLRQNDIVISMANSRALVGKVAFYKGDLDDEPTFGGFLAVIRPVLILPKFLMCYLRASSTREEMIAGASQTTNIANISLAKLNPMLLPVPPLEEQHRIVTKVDELMTLCDALERQTEDSLKAHQTIAETCLATLTNSQSPEDLSQNWTRIEAHFDTLFTTEESVAAFEASIYELAIKGALVEQQPNDEPAATFLKSIGIQPEKAGADLPASWSKCSLGELGKITGGGTPKKTDQRFWGGEIPWVSPKDMKVDYISDSTDKITEAAVAGSAVKLIEPGSLLFVVRGMILAHSFPVAITEAQVTINQDMKAVDLSSFDRAYVLLMMKGLKREVLSRVDRSSHGTCKLVSDKLWSIGLPIPPREEQSRIAAKVKGLIQICATLRARIKFAGEKQTELADTLTSKIH